MEAAKLLEVKSHDRFEQYANKVLSHFKYAYPDEIDIEDICWKYGVDIMPLEPMFLDGSIEDRMKSFSVCSDHRKRGVIFLRPGLNSIERKLILAEEFCHIYIDTTNQLKCDGIKLSKSEKQAKRMATYLLMPYRFLFPVLNLVCDHSVLVPEIADHFLVSDEFAHYRLELLFQHKVDLITNHNGKLGTIEWFD